MDKASLLIYIADKAYDVGFGAKKHFATYDIVSKLPGLIGFLSLFVGIFSLVFDTLSQKVPSATMTVLGVVALYIAYYDRDRDSYATVGSDMIQLFNELKSLYLSVKGSTALTFDQEEASVANIESRFYAMAINKQIMFSDWYAHYKFFWQHQVSWVDEQKRFKFWRDKMPLSATITLATIVILLICSVVMRYIQINVTLVHD